MTNILKYATVICVVGMACLSVALSTKNKTLADVLMGASYLTIILAMIVWWR